MILHLDHGHHTGSGGPAAAQCRRPSGTGPSGRGGRPGQDLV